MFIENNLIIVGMVKVLPSMVQILEHDHIYNEVLVPPMTYWL
jgi:hypothetical protein